MPPLAVNEVVRRAQAGEEAAFEALYREHAGRVFALCLRLSGDGGRATELTQDVFVRCWEQLRSFRGESAFGSWLYRLAVNVVWSTNRGDRRRETRVRPVEDPGAHEPQREAAPPGLRLDLERAIATLPDGAREVFVLFDIEGYRHEEIARLTGIAVGTSKAQLFRARRLLRERLER
ncbi:MAG: RNA polymerase sigma factor [Gemmatimonadales bacterium]